MCFVIFLLFKNNFKLRFSRLTFSICIWKLVGTYEIIICIWDLSDNTFNYLKCSKLYLNYQSGSAQTKLISRSFPWRK